MRDPAGTRPERVLVVSASVGAGHDGAARELAHRLRARGVAVEIRDFLDALPAWLRFTLREGYTGTVNHTPWFYDWLYAALERPGLVQRIGLFVCWLAQRRVLRWYADTGAHAVVSTYPLASQTLGQLVRKGRVAVPTTTFLTDPSVHTLWVNKHIGRHLTTMSATADIAERLYRAPMTVAGPLVPAQFQGALPAARRDQLIEELGVDTARPLALVVTGSLGLGRVEETVDAIVSTDTATPVVLCGRNDRLRQQLAGRSGVVAVGWRNDVHDLMQLCDVMVHNAGGMSFSESLVAGLPAVTYKCIPGHGKANGDVLAESGVAPLADTLDELRTALELQLRPTARSATRASFAAAESDAAQVVLRDLRTHSLAAQLSATRTRARRVTIRRRVSAASGAAVVVLASFGATEGVSAATRHGYGVARMPARSVGLVVAPTALTPLGQHASELAAAKAAVLVPDHLTQQDSVAAERLAAEGIPLLAPGCSPATLIRHSTAQTCGATRTLAADGVPTSRVVVSDGDVEALELVVARRDRTRIVIGEATRARQLSVSAVGGPLKTTASGVWVMHQGRTQTAGDLLTNLREASRRVSAEGLVLRPVTDARTVK